MNYKSGFVGIVGLPNAGKSTLLNALVGEKLSIVSSKPQTTRQKILGLITEDEFQAVLLDSPGHLQRAKGLNSFLQSEEKSIMEDVDVLMCVASVKQPKSELWKLLELCQRLSKPTLVVLNKVDLISFEATHALAMEIQEKFDFELFSGSGLKKPQSLTTSIKKWFQNSLPESPAPLYDPEILTTHSLKELCQEIVRESAFEKLHQEIPFGLAVKVQKFDESESPKITKIYAEIWLNRDSHRPIALGKGGRTLKSIGQTARLQIEKLLGEKVYLELYVKVKTDWVQNPGLMKELGYVHQSS